MIFKVQDSDSLSTSGRGNTIGSVYIDLNPLLMRSVLTLEEDQQQQGDIGNTMRDSAMHSIHNGNHELGASTNSGKKAANPSSSSPSLIMDGWFPIYDTLEVSRNHHLVYLHLQS